MKKCVICGREFEEFGNNPAPLFEGEEEYCCDFCNYAFVVPARMSESYFHFVKWQLGIVNQHRTAKEELQRFTVNFQPKTAL